MRVTALATDPGSWPWLQFIGAYKARTAAFSNSCRSGCTFWITWSRTPSLPAFIRPARLKRRLTCSCTRLSQSPGCLALAILPTDSYYMSTNFWSESSFDIFSSVSCSLIVPILVHTALNWRRPFLSSTERALRSDGDSSSYSGTNSGDPTFPCAASSSPFSFASSVYNAALVFSNESVSSIRLPVSSWKYSYLDSSATWNPRESVFLAGSDSLNELGPMPIGTIWAILVSFLTRSSSTRSLSTRPSK